LVGDQDLATPPALSEQIHQHWPNSQYVVLKDAAHLSSVEQAQAFSDAVMQFLPHCLTQPTQPALPTRVAARSATQT
jgi:pimeloyl-ACP methyl ester carboxylesterase